MCSKSRFSSVLAPITLGTVERENPPGSRRLTSISSRRNGLFAFSFVPREGGEELQITIQDAEGQHVGTARLDDDYYTDPAGDAGGRIACGVIQRAGPVSVSSITRPTNR
jgi:hypothetical protein